MFNSSIGLESSVRADYRDIPSYANAVMRVVFGGVNLNIQLKWHAPTRNKEGRWYASLFDENRNALVRGVKVVPNVPLFVASHYIDLVPDGWIMISGPSRNPGRKTLSSEYRLARGYEF
jgi:hypothetical protein